MTATTIILAAVSPLLVSLIKKCDWPSSVIELLSLAVVAALFVGGQALDGALAWPLSEAFWGGLAAAWGLQQGSYKFLIKGSAADKSLSAFRSK